MLCTQKLRNVFSQLRGKVFKILKVPVDTNEHAQIPNHLLKSALKLLGLHHIPNCNFRLHKSNSKGFCMAHVIRLIGGSINKAVEMSFPSLLLFPSAVSMTEKANRLSRVFWLNFKGLSLRSPSKLLKGVSLFIRGMCFNGIFPAFLAVDLKFYCLV